MSDLLVNVRVGMYHVQLTSAWKLQIHKNLYHRGNSEGRFAVYELFGFVSA